MIPAHAYYRVSTDEQNVSGLGLEAQREAARQYAAKNGLEIVAEYTDGGLCGALEIEKRQALHEAVSALKKGMILLVAKRDRLSRDKFVMASIERMIEIKKCRILSASGEGTEGDTDGDFLQRGMIDLYAQYERRLIKSRTKAALSAKIRRGERAGQIPYGYDLSADGQTLTPNAEQQSVVAQIRSLREAGHSLRAIAQELNSQGIPTQKGNQWNHNTIDSILTRQAA